MGPGLAPLTLALAEANEQTDFEVDFGAKSTLEFSNTFVQVRVRITQSSQGGIGLYPENDLDPWPTVRSTWQPLPYTNESDRT